MGRAELWGCVMGDNLVARLREENEVLRERVRQLEEAVAPPNIDIPVEWRLTLTEARVYRHLASRAEVTKQSLMMALYSDRAEDEPDITILNVFIHHLRKKLKPFGIEIRNIRGSGFAIV